MRRKRFASSLQDAAGIGIGDGDGAVQLANAVMLGLGVAGASVPAGVLPSWVTAGVWAGGIMLAGTALADVMMDYGGQVIAATLAELNVRYNRRISPEMPEPVVRFVRVNSPQPATTRTPASHVALAVGPTPATAASGRGIGYTARDVAAFIQHGAVNGFSRRRYLPDGAGRRFSFASRRAFSRGDYDNIMAMLRGAGLLGDDNRLALPLGDAVAAVMGGGQDVGHMGGLPERASTGSAEMGDSGATGEGVQHVA